MSVPAGTRIFVSHSSQDNEWCRTLVAALTAAHLDIWFDERGLSGGAGWVQTLQHEVQGRDVLLLIITPESWASQWVQEELQLALATRRTILPVLHKPASVEGFLLTRQWVDVVGLDGQAAAQRILTALGSPVVFPAPAAPKVVTFAPQLLTPRLQQMGFIGRVIDGVAVVTPPITPVPAGSFLTGSHPARDPKANDDEGPLRPLEVGAFQIARFPVTVAEYACAVHAQGVPQPGEWNRQRQRLEHPVVLVTWKQALAYVKWLAELTGEPWRLPTEREWEKAARGTDGRVYPWGDRWEAFRANTDDGGAGDTTAVGSYPQGGSPYGAFEMAGSVNEWCGLPPGSPLARQHAWDDSQSGGTLKGGSWDDSPTCTRAVYSTQLYVGERSDSIGFRLVWQVS